MMFIVVLCGAFLPSLAMFGAARRAARKSAQRAQASGLSKRFEQRFNSNIPFDQFQANAATYNSSHPNHPRNRVYGDKGIAFDPRFANTDYLRTQRAFVNKCRDVEELKADLAKDLAKSAGWLPYYVTSDATM